MDYLYGAPWPHPVFGKHETVPHLFTCDASAGENQLWACVSRKMLKMDPDLESDVPLCRQSSILIFLVGEKKISELEVFLRAGFKYNHSAEAPYSLLLASKTEP
ncbi:hypothetical protein NPIL_484571 [Nephila pilipes]|uniref:Uncharacterized protein n=1 Tax=Nephila pilipes TaxID=299642 RepID=A0A8X6Q193_NEPPI|nr:hypothetical protein NPIL_484571 [Nephila pilipes]